MSTPRPATPERDLRRVQGVVLFEGGTPAHDVDVSAADRGLRDEEPLGEAKTARDGTYAIDYDIKGLLDRARGSADLVVRVLGPDGALLATSPVTFDAPADAVIDLTIPAERQAAPSLYERLADDLAARLGDVAPAELEEDGKRQDLTFLAGQTGFELAVLARYALAHRLVGRGLDPEFWFALLGGSFFVYDPLDSLEGNVAAIDAALPALDAAATEKALTAAFGRGDLPSALRERSEEWVQAFLDLSAQAILGEADDPGFARAALDDAGIKTAKKQATFARLLTEHRALTPDALERLRKDRSFKEDEVDALQTTYRLAELTGGGFGIVRQVKEEFGVRKPEQIPELAKVTDEEWVKVVERASAAGELELPLEDLELEGEAGRLPLTEAYARSLGERLRGTFPTAAFAGGLERALGNGGTRGLRHGKSIARLLEHDADFDLLRTNLDTLPENADPDVRGELKAVQRVFKVAPNFEATDTLVADGIHSAQLAYRLGETEFVRRYEHAPGFTPDSAALAWNRAAETHAAVLTVVGDVKSLDPESLPAVLGTDESALAAFPNWESLFQTGDICHCEQCRSVLSPAAYFTDLLMFLRDRRAANPAVSVKDVLFARRSDLGYLELNCENAHTTLPYIDVVCEVLERVVAAGASDVELAGFTAMPAGGEEAAVAAALDAAGLVAGEELTVSQVVPTDPDRWVVHGEPATYLLKKLATPNFFAELLPNTKASSDELRAYPAYVDANAYVPLRQARFPLALPFDLFAEEVRAAFTKSQLRRWELMDVARGPAAPNDPSDGDIAAEYFGIASDPAAAFDERQLILVADPTVAGQQAVWGEPGNPAWLVAVANVKTFLFKTGLDYEQLLALLDLAFINPGGALAIQHLDASCDTDRKTIQGLDADALDRIHRFLRLWRKLDGWPLWQLDLALRAPGVGAGALDEPFLINLEHLMRLRERLGGAKAPVAALCALCGDLDTATSFTHQWEPRRDGFYQDTFLNRRLIQPLDPAFAVAAVDVPAPTVETIPGHLPVVLAALGISESDAGVLAALSGPAGPYATDDLTLANLSFLWRHAWLVKRLKLSATDWRTVLELLQEDVGTFADARAAREFVERVDQVRATGFTPDELKWILAADLTVAPAPKEADVARFLTGLRARLQAIRAAYDPVQYGLAATPADAERMTALLTSLLQQLHRDEAEASFFVATLRDDVQLARVVAVMPLGFDFPQAITDTIPIRYDETAQTLRFTGWMTSAQRTTLLNDPALAAATGIADYQAAIQELFERPRLALKFLDPVFSAPLDSLPAAVDFTALADPALTRKITYDPEERTLSVVGILQPEERQALDALSADAGYRNAVNSLFTQPATGIFPAGRLWLQEPDLLFPLRDLADPDNDNLAANLKTAIERALAFLSSTQSDALVVEQAGAQLGLTAGLTRRLLSYAVLPDTLLEHLTGAFATTNGVIDQATQPAIANGWNWAVRVAALWRAVKLTLPEWERLRALTAAAGLLDPLTLPLDATDPIGSVEQLVRTSRLFRLRDSLPETGTTLFEVLEKLDAGDYTAADASDFAADVERLDARWSAEDVESLVASLDLAYPGDYLLVESWERLRRALVLAASLNARFDTLKTFAAPAMTGTHARMLKELLRSKLGTETWLPLCTEIQDALRERKRDALVAYLLTQPRPADAPTGKWESANDLYAHYLLDVEMASCQLTSRLVQASGSVQLFVQRCFMGLEPTVRVEAGGPDGDSAWRWWKWMRKYRVWEANRKVFLWPENWIEPELKPDRSAFFKDLEKELVQNELNDETVESAFTTYLEKLNGVARLELAGFYQEDDGDNTIIHVFGRTIGADPHVYYYRRYDYRQWTPWEKVDLDIQGDYLVPAVIGGRLFLFWPVFTEVPDNTGANTTVATPKATNPSSTVKPASKRLKLQLAVSDYRRGRWTHKRVSKHALMSDGFDVEIVRRHYELVLIDRSASDGRVGVRVRGWSVDATDDDAYCAYLSGTFDIAGCDGVPVLAQMPGSYTPALRPEVDSTGYLTSLMKYAELPALERADQQDDFALTSVTGAGGYLTQVLDRTPGSFAMTPPWQLSYLDRFWSNGLAANLAISRDVQVTAGGTWLPYFYDDQKRTFFVLPALAGLRGRGRDDHLTHASYASYGTALPWTSNGPAYYPEVKRAFREQERMYEGEATKLADGLDLGAISQADRDVLEARLAVLVPSETPPPYTDAELRAQIVRLYVVLLDLQLGAATLGLFNWRRFHFKTFYHPFVCDFARTVYNPLKGIPGLMTREVQLRDSGFDFARVHLPTAFVLDPSTPDYYPRENVDFSPDGAYSPYNWELFFHAPLLIANALSRDQRFEEARDWYHYIFNPIGVDSPVPGGSAMSRYWITKPFFETTDPQYVGQRIDAILHLLAGDTTAPGYSAAAQDALTDQVRDWRTHPFEPHRIANYRTVAYQKTVVMKYLDNLIAWGDSLFRQDSMESINEATQLYVLASELLGPAPKRIPPAAKPPVESFNELEAQLDAFANALVEVENLVPVASGTTGLGGDSAPLPMLYFCIPRNEKLLGYWDTVADRLYKIRHCMNIEGGVRQLALFEPPIDPGALVKAVAGGVDISAALSDLSAPLPLYRFNVLLQQANAVCADVKSLGAALLTALEKQDAEALGRLRQGQEIQALDTTTQVRENQLDEARQAVEALKRGKELAQIKQTYYASREFINTGEAIALGLNAASTTIGAGVAIGYVLSGVLKLIPQFNLGASGFGGSPHVTGTTGGVSFGGSAEDLVKTLQATAAALDKGASIAATVASYTRRKEDWDFQRDLATKELTQIDRQIAGAELRVAIAARELDHHRAQIDDAREVDAFMRTKYTNEELYQWQVREIAGTYRESYRLAHDLAKRAERCLRFELGVQDTRFVSFGAWDDLHRGLQAGERLQTELRRMEAGYVEQNRRERELVKHISLVELDPLALVRLRETGRCFFEVPEELFDLDFPGHYFRRIKSVSLTIPCVRGPYTTVSCTLRLLKNSVRIKPGGVDGYPRASDDTGAPIDDDRFIEANVPVRAVSGSSGQNDSGVFDLNFRDDRYLPFEGAGAISEWSLELFNDAPSNNPDPNTPDFGRPLRQFDYATIADAVMHISYTAREDAGTLKNQAIAHLRHYLSQDATAPAFLVLDLRREFATEWSRFLHPAGGAANVFELDVAPALFPFRDAGRELKINQIMLLARCAKPTAYQVKLTPPLPAATTLSLTKLDAYGGLHYAEKDLSAAPIAVDPDAPPTIWRMTMTAPGGGTLTQDPVTLEMEVTDALLVLGYQWE